MKRWIVIGLSTVAFALVMGSAPRPAWVQADDPCSSTGGRSVQLPSTKLIIEHNATDEDTGVHGLFDGVDWTKLCVLNGFSRPTLDVHLLPSVTSLTIPTEFLESNTSYELEVLALEASGNQTISVLFFQTE